MKLWGVSMVRNEADIIEAFVRHNLTVLDGLLVVDHGSADSTLRILAALCAERVRLVVLRSDAAGYLQSEIVTSAVREAFSRGRADAVFPLDADEFLRIGGRDELVAALAAIPPGHHGRIAWPTYVPPLDGEPADMIALLRAARRCDAKLPLEPRVLRKVALTAHFAADPSATLTMGNHGVILGRDPRNSPTMPHVALPERVVEVCHVPIRSARQFVTKTAIKRLARVAARRDYPPASPVHAALDAIRRGSPLTPALMLSTHLVVDDPAFAAALAPRDAGDGGFLGDVRLRYTDGAPADPVPVVLSAVERLVRRVVESRAPAHDGERPGAAG
ncbi:MAG TPA: glycosyltransferase family 2 protein [Casimicrobiaceae bacterium]|nr:glycosyltransferase family 2 protein [Casimicrobiaceae bacterium]